MDRYELKSAQPIANSTFASGAYGSVSLIQVSGGVKCIEKRLHDILVGYGQNEDVDQEGKRRITEKFHRECILLSQMRHPNIVQFMGVRFNREKCPSLIMEYLPMTVDKCIDKCNRGHFSIPLCFKLSILRDISYGLLHLHLQEPSIVHRDLSAANVLLTSDLRAKIADFGMSRILTLAELRRINKLTKVPGAQYIMPPEAFKEDCRYDSKIDVFSFGVLALYLLGQDYPEVSPPSVLTPQHVINKETEIGRRMKYIDNVSRTYSSDIVSFVKACLQDRPERRPATAELKDMSEQFCKNHPNEHGDTIKMLQTITQMVGVAILATLVCCPSVK